MLTRDRITELIPHQGAMCLLDEVEAWSEREVRCLSRSHLDPSNPLRHAGRLTAVHLVEYAAQAMAVHGALVRPVGGSGLDGGLLAAARDVELHVERLDDLARPLRIRATRLVADARGCMYQFEAHADEQLLGSGRLSVIRLPLEVLPDGPKSPS